MSYLGIHIFTWSIDWTQTVNGDWSFDLREIAVGFGPEFFDPQQSHLVHGFQFEAQFRDTEIDALATFLDAIKGRANPFWLPGPASRFRITRDLGTLGQSSSSSSRTSSSSADEGDRFLIIQQGEETAWELQAGRYLYFTKSGQSARTSKITSVTANTNGTETVLIDDKFTPKIDQTWTAVPLYLVRLAADVEQAPLQAERVQLRNFRVVELPKEYARLEEFGGVIPPEEYVWLYRFTARIPGGTAVWRFTSAASDVTIADPATQSSSSSSTSESVSSQTSTSQSSASAGESSSSTSSSSTSGHSSSSSQSSSSSPSSANSSSSSSGDGQTVWTAARISHGAIKRDMRLGGSVTLQADYQSVEPLRLLIPLRLSAPLKVEILRTTVNGIEPESIFLGQVRKPTVEGRNLTAQCHELGDIMELKLPGFFIQRTCNYRVFDPNTCRASRTTFGHTVTITRASGREAVMQGATLAGLAADWFAQGKIEIGSGFDMQVLSVLASAAAVGNTVAITVAAPVVLELPVSGTALPGCDGTRLSCGVAKFNNFVNFGGHETPRDNLTLTAIRSQTGTGGKK